MALERLKMANHSPMTGNDMDAVSSKVRSLDAERDRRRFVALAHADHDWLQVKASFALEGIDLDDDDAERAGRILAGAITTEQAIEEIKRKYTTQK